MATGAGGCRSATVGVFLSGSFDTFRHRWSLATEFAEQCSPFPFGCSETRVAFLKDGRMVTAEADARIAIWTAGGSGPDRVFDGHALQSFPPLSVCPPERARMAVTVIGGTHTVDLSLGRGSTTSQP